jgi:dihydroorotate dehydrogenase
VAYRLLFNTALKRIAPERAHALAVNSLRAATAARPFRAALTKRSRQGSIAVDALGLRFSSPLGVAAGLDKNGEWYRALTALGFGFVELGTVTPRAQEGNERPRIARILDDRALVNRMGFPNQGADHLAARLSATPAGAPLGVNLGKNRDTPLADAAGDYATGARAIGSLADYLVLNVSSPNTPGLRSLESSKALGPLIEAVKAEVRPTLPVLVKISPDLANADVDAVAELALRAGLAGVIATNTTVDRGVLSEQGRAAVASFEGGGVSGPPLARRSLEVLQRLHARLRGSEAIVVSVGGTSSAEDVWQRLLAGATLVQAYTGFIYGGPGWPAAINRELAARLRDAGAGTIGEIIGTGT